MKSTFFQLADHVCSLGSDSTVVLANFYGEDVDLCRFNHGKVREAGRVRGNEVELTLARGARHASGTITLTENYDQDCLALDELNVDLRQVLEILPDDPHFLYSKEVRDSEILDTHDIGSSSQLMAADILSRGKNSDLVGYLTSGAYYRGFANSFGQRNWFQSHSFNLSWSQYLHSDKAIKSAYCDKTWDRFKFNHHFDLGEERFQYLDRKPVSLEPGQYRAYLSPAALREILRIVGFGGFSEKSMQTKSSSLLKMAFEGQELSPKVTLTENRDLGIVPPFDRAGYTLPAQVPLIREGKRVGSLVAPRSAKEFGLEPNCAFEMPKSLQMAGGNLAEEDILPTLDTGVYIGNLWYTNYSDRTSCKVTGMTRFACFWVENGKIVAPIKPMRFDDSVFRLLGDHLIDLTSDQELLIAAENYQGRAVECASLPGALVSSFALTL